jgi:hypothetical protein
MPEWTSRRPGPHVEAPGHHAPDRGGQRRPPARHHAGVEDERRVVALVDALEPAHDGLAADLLLAVGDDRHVAAQVARRRQVEQRPEQAVEVALVVRGAARVDPAVPHLGSNGGDVQASSGATVCTS